MRETGPIQILIVAASPYLRTALKQALTGMAGLQVVAGAKSSGEARDQILAHRPDVILLDLDLPQNESFALLEKLRVHYPVPVLVCVEARAAREPRALRALDLGALDLFPRPTFAERHQLGALAAYLAEQIHAAHRAMPTRPPLPRSARQPILTAQAAGVNPAHHVVAIGASTGGTEAIKSLLSVAPPDFPPVVIVQHMPAGFTRAFAEALDLASPLTVKEAEDGDVLVPGSAFLGPGGRQMSLWPCRPGQWRVSLGGTELVNRHCPSVDVLFESVAQHVGKRAVGVLLTGMGDDGAKGLLRMREAGAITIAQNKRSCVVFGMPKVAIDLGAAELTSPPRNVPGLALNALRRRSTQTLKPVTTSKPCEPT